MEIKEILTKIDSFDEELIEESEKKPLRKMRLKAGTDRIIFAQLFVKCYDILDSNSFLFKDNEETIETYLQSFDKIDEIKELIESYGDGGLGTYFIGEKIRIFVSENKKDMKGLIDLFFKIVLKGDIFSFKYEDN